MVDGDDEVWVPKDEHLAALEAIGDCKRFALDGRVAGFCFFCEPRTYQDDLPVVVAALRGDGFAFTMLLGEREANTRT